MEFEGVGKKYAFCVIIVILSTVTCKSCGLAAGSC